jgi:hypothetical protein
MVITNLGGESERDKLITAGSGCLAFRAMFQIVELPSWAPIIFLNVDV